MTPQANNNQPTTTATATQPPFWRVSEEELRDPKWNEWQLDYEGGE